MANNFFRVNKGLTLTPGTTPTGATTGDIYFDSTQNAPMVYANSAWTPIGSSSTINYIPTAVSSGSSIGSFLAYTDLAGTAPVDGTGTPTGDIVITSATNSALTGTNLLQISKTLTANTQGKGLGLAFSIDNAKKGKTLQVEFEYILSSGTFVAGNPADRTAAGDSDLTVWIYDVTNAALIQPSNYRLFSNSTTLSSKFTATFQAASNSTSYRLILHSGTTNTATFALYMDQLSISPVVSNSGAVMTDPVQYTPTFGAGYGTVTNQKIYWQQNGKFMRVFGTATMGTASAGTGEISLPSGRSIDSSYYQSTAKNLVGGIRPIVNTGGAGSGGTTQRLGFDGTNLDKVWLTSSSAQDAAGGTFVKTNVNSAFSTSDTLNIDFTIPILGWSSNVQLSSDAGNSQVVFSGSKSSTQAITAAVTDITFATVKDSVGAWSGSTYTVAVPGDYSVSGSLTDNGSTAQIIYVYLNGAISKTLGYMSAGNAMCGNAILTNLKSGDVVSLRSSASTTLSANAGQNLSIFKLANPQTIAANDTIAASYKSTAGGSIGTSYTLQSFATKLQDTTGSWNGNTFTAPIQGLFRITSNVRTPNLTLGATQSFDVAVYKNGSIYMLLNSVLGNGGTNNWYMSGGSIEVPLLAGETLQIYAKASVATTQNTDANSNFVSIVKVG